MDISILPQDFTILIVLAPFFLLIFSLAVLLQKGFPKATIQSLFFVIATFVLAVAFIYQLFNGYQFSVVFFGLFVLSSCLSAYLALQKKKK